MKKLFLAAAFAGIAFAGAAGASPAPLRLEETGLENVRLRGHSGKAFDACVKNQVMATDADYLAAPFSYRNEALGGWRAEFWGKYMHAAAPLAKRTGSPELTKSVRSSLAKVVAAQEPDGYIGTYRKADRVGRGWDVWGNKYTLMGLLYGYEATGDAAALAAARRLGDYLVATFGDGRRDVCATGEFGGLASLSVIEPLVKLARATGERKYLDLVGTFVREMEGAAGPKLLAYAAIPPMARKANPGAKKYPLKAYEMMSCYQGLADYALATGDAAMLAQVVTAVETIGRTEITLAGGGSASELWCDGAANQHRPLSRAQETCVTVTWMRLCEKMLTVTGDPKWADAIERSFYNAYLGSLARDGSTFVTYLPLGGTRAPSADSCYMETGCCKANGPRGFLTYIGTLAMSGEDGLYLNWYDTSDFKARLPDGSQADFEVFSLYPSNNRPYPCDPQIRISYRSRATQDFALHLRIPAWSAKTKILLNGKELRDEIRPGTYHALRRTWTEGDAVEIDFDMTCRTHFVADGVAFTVGPILLARDSRFGDGDLSECIVKKRVEILDDAKRPFCAIVANDEPEFWMEYALKLPMGSNVMPPERNAGRVIRFCDFSSAGNFWSQRNYYQSFLRMDYGALWL